MQKKSTIEKDIGKINILFSLSDDIEVALEFAESEGDESLLNEAESKLKELAALIKEAEFTRMLSGEMDKNSAIISINPGAGGTEAQDWADMLRRMYFRWAELKSFKIEILDYQHGDEAGIKAVTMLVKGEYAYGYLKAEVGVHRLVRISPFDANKRRHTSFASVHVYPDIEGDIDIEINESDIRIDTYRASGAGGQHINKTDSAVRITHIPTNTVTQCQSERSQHKNKATAMKILKAKLYEVKVREEKAKLQELSGEKKEIGWGSQIRSYVMQPYQLVKDHRTNIETGDVNSVLDGAIDKFIEGYLMS